MEARIVYTSGDKQKEVMLDDFKNVYFYESMIEVRGADEDGLERSIKVPKESFVSVQITK